MADEDSPPRPNPPVSLSVAPEPTTTLVAHVVVVGFHAQLGNRIEFAYPRLLGDPVLRSPKLTDTADISSDISTPTLARRNSITPSNRFLSPQSSPSSAGVSSPRHHDWGVLPDEWSFLPFMALPDGVHDHIHDLVFFTLPPDVHCVACFRQIPSHVAKTHSASDRRSYEQSVASRGSVQKSVVLLCRRPFFGVLADRLIPAVRAYFDQADFANTQVLSKLYHSLNLSLVRPSLAIPDTLFHGLDLRALLRKLGPQLLAVVKLILLERRVLIYSDPVRPASNAVIALASIFDSALDSIAPTLPPLDLQPDHSVSGLPLALFSQHDRVLLQPYAPLPLVSKLIPNDVSNGCLIGTSHNVGLLLSSAAAAHARSLAAAQRAATLASLPVGRRPPIIPTFSMSSNPPASSKPAAGVPVVDALVNFSTGKVSVSGALEPFCRVTKPEKAFIRDLLTAVGKSAASVSASGSTGPFLGSDDHIRSRLRLYLLRFLQSVASVDSVHGGPVGGETWSREMVEEFDLTGLEVYNDSFVRRWLTTRNAAEWARHCGLRHSTVVPPPPPEMPVSNTAQGGPTANVAYPGDDVGLNVERVAAAGLNGLRKNMAELGKFSSEFSTRAAEGLSSLFKRIEVEVAKMDTAVGEARNNFATSGRPVTGRAAPDSTVRPARTVTVEAGNGGEQSENGPGAETTRTMTESKTSGRTTATTKEEKS